MPAGTSTEFKATGYQMKGAPKADQLHKDSDRISKIRSDRALSSRKPSTRGASAESRLEHRADQAVAYGQLGAEGSPDARVDEP